MNKVIKIDEYKITSERRFNMKAKLDENKIEAAELVLPLSTFTQTEEYAVKNVQENYEYINNKKTDTFLSTTLTCIDVETLAVLRIKVEAHINLTAKMLEQSEQPVYIKIPIEQTFVRPYAIEYGKVKVSIIAPSVAILNN